MMRAKDKMVKKTAKPFGFAVFRQPTKSFLSAARHVGAGGIYCRRQAPECACLANPTGFAIKLKTAKPSGFAVFGLSAKRTLSATRHEGGYWRKPVSSITRFFAIAQQERL